MAKDSDILADARECFEECQEAEVENREEALDDLKFARLSEQWPEKIKAQREIEGRPCLTINRLPAFIRQVVNDARQNKPSIRVHPVDDKGDKETADVINGLIRNIEYTSNADVAYDTGAEFAVTMGWGYWRVGIEYAHDDTFDRDLCIERVGNPFSVYGDPHSTAADSSDWMKAFVVERLSKDAFERKYKGAEPVSWDSEGYGQLKAPWLDDGGVLVAEYWSREEVAREIVLLTDGTILDAKRYAKAKDVFDALGATVQASRATRSWKVTQRLMTGAEVLEQNEWAGKYIPLIPVYGDEVNVEGKRYFRSLVRDAKDPQRQFNYWRTTSTELVALAPKAPFIGPKGSFKTDAAKWASANTQSHSYIEYDVVQNAPRPERQAFAGVPAGALQEALNASDDMKAVMGLYDASLGARSNETSGKAILARQREGDVSTFHFTDNVSRAIRHTGRVLLDLIPTVYTGERMIRVLGEDKKPTNARIGEQPSQQPLPDGTVQRVYSLATGKYDLTVETGPSFTTQREEMVATLTELIRAYPPAAPIVGDILVRNMDVQGGEEISERLKALLPPQVQGQNPEAQKAQQAIQQLTQALDQMKADQSLKARELDIKAFDAETKRIETVAKVMAPPPLAQKTTMDAVNSPDILPGGGPAPMPPMPPMMPGMMEEMGEPQHIPPMKPDMPMGAMPAGLPMPPPGG